MTKKITNKELDSVVTYMFIKFGYGQSFIVPYLDGLKIIAGLERAEKVEYGYSEGISFTAESLEYEIHNVSQKDYRKTKMDFLLGLTEAAT